MKELENFTADSARDIMKSINDEELYEVLAEIKKVATGSDHIAPSSTTQWYSQLSSCTVNELRKRGFEVKTGGGIALQKEGIHHIISW